MIICLIKVIATFYSPIAGNFSLVSLENMHEQALALEVHAIPRLVPSFHSYLFKKFKEIYSLHLYSLKEEKVMITDPFLPAVNLFAVSSLQLQIYLALQPRPWICFPARTSNTCLDEHFVFIKSWMLLKSYSLINLSICQWAPRHCDLILISVNIRFILDHFVQTLLLWSHRVMFIVIVTGICECSKLWHRSL